MHLTPAVFFAGRNFTSCSKQSLIIVRGIKSIFSFQSVSHGLSRDCKKKNEGVVSKETVVLRRWGSSIQKFGFINGVDNVNWPPYRDSKSFSFSF